jgi:hypothetical protein
MRMSGDRFEAKLTPAQEKISRIYLEMLRIFDGDARPGACKVCFVSSRELVLALLATWRDWAIDNADRADHGLIPPMATALNGLTVCLAAAAQLGGDAAKAHLQFDTAARLSAALADHLSGQLLRAEPVLPDKDAA